MEKIKNAPEGARKNLQFDNSIQDRLLSIFKSSDRRLSRYELTVLVYGEYTESHDRNIRHAIQELRCVGEPISSNSHEVGYRYGDKEECMRTAREYEKRARIMLETAKKLRKWIEESDTEQIIIAEVERWD